MRSSRAYGVRALPPSPTSARIGTVRLPAGEGDSRGGDPSDRDRAADQPESVVPTESRTSRPQNPLVSDSYVRPAFTIEQIRTFLIVASREHITQAARTLGLSQPAVTQQIQLLERTLGVQLLERLGRGVRLTDAGEQVAGACLLIMRSLENLERTVHSIRGLEAGSLALGATQVAGSYYLSPALTAFNAAHPAVTVDITTATCPDICDGVAAGVLECGLVDGPLPRIKLDYARVAQDEVVLAVHPAHRLAGLERISLQALAGTSFLAWEQDTASDSIAEHLLGSVHQALPRISMANIEAVRRALMTEPRFIAALPRIAIDEDLENGTLVSTGRRHMSRSVWAVRRHAGPASPAAAGFWKILLSVTSPPLPALTADPCNFPCVEDDLTGP